MGIRELRDNLTAVVRRVRAGETIEITHHGQLVATLAPAPGDRIERLCAAGDITIGERLAVPIRREPPVGSTTATDALREDRAER